MRLSGSLLAFAALFTVLLPVAADEPAEQLTPLFNGRDLTGWVNVNCAPETFTVRDGIIICTGIPTGVMRTERMYENFVLELEWKHIREKGNAGLFVWSDAITSRGVPFTRSIEVQILDGLNTESYTSHGDIFSIHGAKLTPDRPHPRGAARCLPSEHRCKPAGEWNHYRVTCNDGVIKLAVNGKEVSGGYDCHPRKGYICLESEGSECHFRNLRIRELPSTNPTPEETATADEGFRSLYTGLDLAGWKHSDAATNAWRPKDWILSYEGKESVPLVSEESFGDIELIVDYRWTTKLDTAPTANETRAPDAVLRLRGDKGAVVLPHHTQPGQWQRLRVAVRGKEAKTTLNGGEPTMFNIDAGESPLTIVPFGRPVQLANIYVRRLK